jgi:hypothetical protein
VIPLQGPDNSVHVNKTSAQLQIYQPSYKATADDMEVMLAPRRVTLLVQKDFVAALNKQDANGSLLCLFKERLGMDDLPLEDVTKKQTSIAREQCDLAQRYLERVRVEKQTLTRQRDRLKTKNSNLRQSFDRERAENQILVAQHDRGQQNLER